MKPESLVWLSFLPVFVLFQPLHPASADVDYVVQDRDGSGVRSLVDAQRADRVHPRGTTNEKGFLSDPSWNCEAGDLVVARPTIELAAHYAVYAQAACNTPTSEIVISKVKRGVRRVVALIDGGTENPFNKLVLAGLGDAAKEYAIHLETYSISQISDEILVELVNAVLDANVEGVMLSMPSKRVLAIHDALAVDTPIITINAGAEAMQAINALADFTQGDYETGIAAGRKMKELGAQRSLCLSATGELDVVDPEARCRGFADGFGGSVEIVSVFDDTANSAANVIRDSVARSPDLGGVMVATPELAPEAMSALEKERFPGHIELGTIDLTGDVLDGIASGRMSFSVDRQPYLLGYLSLSALNLHRKGGVSSQDLVLADLLL